MAGRDWRRGRSGRRRGWFAGKGIAEWLDPAREDAYWRQNYTSEPYYESGLTYEDYAPAYRTGYEGRARYGARAFDEVETDLQNDYYRSRGGPSLEWDKGREAARAAWEHAAESASGDLGER